MGRTMPTTPVYKQVGTFLGGYAIALRSDGTHVVVDESLHEVQLPGHVKAPPRHRIPPAAVSSPDPRPRPSATDNTLEQQTREAVVWIARLIYERNYNVTIDGNISTRLDHDTVLFTPTGRHNGFLQPEDLIMTDLDGTALQGQQNPSSEYRLHTFIYRRRPDVRAVIHVHSPYATAASLAGMDLWKTWVTIAPIPTTAYARIASADSPRVLEPYVDDYNWAILPRHGSVTWADSLWNAFLRLEGLEHLAHIVMVARATGPIQPMSPERRSELLRFWNLERQDNRP